MTEKKLLSNLQLLFHHHLSRAVAPSSGTGMHLKHFIWLLWVILVSCPVTVLVKLAFTVINVGTPGKIVSSACYDKQQVCVYLQPFSC